MDIYETLNFLNTKLKENQNNSSDLMYGYTIETDPYADLSKLVPLILIEAERTEFVNRSEYGHPTTQDHFLSFAIFESAQKIDFDIYKSKVNVTIKKLIDKLMTIDDWRISKIVPMEIAHNEIEIGALKTTAAVVDIKVRTNWKD